MSSVNQSDPSASQLLSQLNTSSLDSPEPNANGLGGTQPVSYENQAGSAADTNSAKREAELAEIARSININLPRDNSTVTNGTPKDGQFPATINNSGDGKGPLTVKTTHGVGESPSLTSVQGSFSSGNASGKVTATPAELSASGSLKVPIDPNTTATFSGSLTQPIGGPTSTSLGANVQSGGFSVGLSGFTGPNAGSEIKLTAPLGSSTTATFTSTDRNKDQSSSVGVESTIGNTTLTAGYSTGNSGESYNLGVTQKLNDQLSVGGSFKSDSTGDTYGLNAQWKQDSNNFINGTVTFGPNETRATVGAGFRF